MTPSSLPDHLIPELRDTYDRYIDHTLRGCTLIEASRRVGVSAENASNWVVTAEDDKYVIARRALLMGSLDPRKLWTPAEATLMLKRIAMNEIEKASSRVAAARELNLLMGFVSFPDVDAHAAKQGRSLADFYRDTPNNPPPH